jgi:hypothetical protein
LAKKNVVALSGVKDWQFRDLRRTFVTNLRSLGVDRLVVSKLLNHDKADSTSPYDRWADDPAKRAAMEARALRLHEIID